MLVSPTRLMVIQSPLRAVLDFSFLSGSLDSRMTFTRASAGWAYNSSGVLTSYATDTPRFDYNPATLAARGLLLEEARTNLLLRSAELGTTWTTVSASVSVNQVNAPDGTLAGDQIIESAVAATNHGLSQTITAASNVTYTLSCFAKASTRTWLRLGITDGGSNNVQAWFDLANGVVGSTLLTGTGSAVVSSIQDVGNSGWYRCILSGIPASVNSASIVCILRLATGDSNQTYSGDGTSSLYAWGTQLEAGAFVTSYIPTTSASATRATDICSIATSTFGYNDTEGTLFAAYTPLGITGLQTAVYLDDGTNNERMGVRSSSGALAGVVVDGGVSQASISGGAQTATATKVALAYKLNDIALVANGVAGTTDTSATLPTVTKLQIGSRTVSAEPMSGWYTRTAYYNRRLPDATLLRIAT